LISQDGDYTTQPDIKPFQFTFLSPPLSTDFGQSNKYVYNLSLNLLFGQTGGVHGFEFGSLINVNKDYMKGVQFAGLANIVGGEANGFQFAGFMNMVNEGKLYWQFAGFLNAAGDIEGWQFGGFMNSAYHVEGLQFGGFMNMADEVVGVQFGGFLNVAKYVKGTQIAGFLNVCDSIDGLPIGFINIVGEGGYSKFEVSYADVGNVFIAGKLGVKKLYNIYTIGKLNGPLNRMSFGFGVGNETDLGPKSHLNIEALVHQEMFIGEKKPNARFSSFMMVNKTNIWSQVKFNFGYQPNEGMELFVGPTLNVSTKGINGDIDSDLNMGPNWSIQDFDSKKGRNVRVWIGFNAGIRL
jgi:hypothetical protein